MDYVVCNPSAAKFVVSFAVDPRGYSDHGSLHVKFSFPLSRPPTWIWSMPMDLSPCRNILYDVHKHEVETHVMASFQHAILDNDTDAAFQVFASSFEQAATQSSQRLGFGPLAPKYFGRAKGQLVKARPSLNSCRAMVPSCLTESPFARGRRHFNWFGNLLGHIRLRVVKQDQARTFREFWDADLDQGDKWHAACIKTPAASMLTSLVPPRDVWVSPLRISKGCPACFRLCSQAAVSPGDVWNVAGHRLSVASVHGDYVSLNGPFTEGMSVRVVQHFSWNGDPAYVAQQVRDYWDRFWCSEKLPDMGFTAQAIERLPQLPQFDCTISLEELTAVLKKLQQHKARGTDGFANMELTWLSPDHLS